MAGIKDYSSTAGNNTSVGGVSIAEGMLPSNINNAFRAVTADIREWYNDSQWVIYGDGDGSFTAAYASGTSFTINGSNVTGVYHADRRIKAVGSSTGTIYGTIASSSFSSNTTVNVTWDSGSLSSETLTIYVGALSKSNTSLPAKVVDTGNLADNAVTTAKITNANVTADKLAGTLDISAKTVTLPDGSVSATKIAADAVITSKILNANVTTAKIADANVTTAKIADDAVTAAKIADAVLVTNSEHSSATADDVTLFTTSASDARYFRQDTSETISSGDTWSAGDTKIATTGAIDNRIIDLVDDVGGFVPIATELAFPNANPDVNNGAGTLVSIKALSTNYTSSGSGVISISNGTVGNSTVTINGAENSTTYASGFGMIVETTTTLNTYNFHRLVPKATEVTTVSSNIANINTVAGNNSNINTVAGANANITTAATNITDINTFANRYRIASSAPGSSLDIGDLYFDTTANELKVYKSSGWAAAGSSVNGTSQRYKYIATSSQTTFTGSDNNGNTLAYDSGYIDVFMNGVHLDPADYTATNGSSVVLGSGAASGDIIYVVAFGTFNVAAINADNLASGTVNNARLPATIADKTIQATALSAKGDGSSTAGKIQLNDNDNSHSISLQAPTLGSNITFKLPATDGSNGQVLKTDGSGNLSFATVSETKPTVGSISPTTITNSQTAVTITGTNFVSVPQVEAFNPSTGIYYVADSIAYTSATTIVATFTLAVDATYKLRVENPDGLSVLSGNLLTVSDIPTWSTGAGSLGSVAALGSMNFTVAATSDSTITYSKVSGSFPGGGSINASTGAITGTESGSTTETTYNFTIRATDNESQTADRAFTITVTHGSTGGGQFN